MDLFDAIIIGSGPSGVAAAFGLNSQSVLMLDVGFSATEKKLPHVPLTEIKRSNESFEYTIGEEFESLKFFDEGYLSPKLKSPLMRFILKMPGFLKGLDDFENFDAHISYAKGGLANAWGAGLIRYNDYDLKSFPINQADLDPFYDLLTEEIGISGEEDDLKNYFVSGKHLLPPLKLSPLAQRFLARYQKGKKVFNKKNIFVGKPRHAILSQDHRNRPAYSYLCQDFFQPNNPSIFNPSILLDELVRKNKLIYKPGFFVQSFEEIQDGSVRVFAKNVDTGEVESFYSKTLLVAAGTLNSSRIVLNSFKDYETRLPLLDNKVSFMPFVDLGLIGSAFAENVFPGGELIAIDTNDPKKPLQASIYGLNGVLRTDLIAEFPLSMKTNIALTRYVAPALGMMQLFYPDSPSEQNYISLKSNGGLRIKYQSQTGYSEKSLIRMLLRMGYFTSSLLKKVPAPGSSVHYVGSIPMVKKREDYRGRYYTDVFGRLAETSNVFVVDGCLFPALPVKNHSFTLMANAMRIGSYIRNKIQ